MDLSFITNIFLYAICWVLLFCFIASFCHPFSSYIILYSHSISLWVSFACFEVGPLDFFLFGSLLAHRNSLNFVLYHINLAVFIFILSNSEADCCCCCCTGSSSFFIFRHFFFNSMFCNIHDGYVFVFFSFLSFAIRNCLYTSVRVRSISDEKKKMSEKKKLEMKIRFDTILWNITSRKKRMNTISVGYSVRALFFLGLFSFFSDLMMKIWFSLQLLVLFFLLLSRFFASLPLPPSDRVALQYEYVCL